MDAPKRKVNEYVDSEGETKRRRTHNSCLIGNGVEVKPSTLEGAGNGLFACIDFESGDIITEFCGKFITKMEADALKSELKHTHVRTVDFGYLYIDGLKDPISATGKGGASFSNHKRISEANSKFHKVYDTKSARNKIYLKATKRILKDEEIFTNYGKTYWEFFSCI